MLGQQNPISKNVEYSAAMNFDRDTDKTNVKALIALWQDEEERLRLIFENPQTSHSSKVRMSERLVSVRDQIQGLSDELDILERTD